MSQVMAICWKICHDCENAVIVSHRYQSDMRMVTGCKKTNSKDKCKPHIISAQLRGVCRRCENSEGNSEMRCGLLSKVEKILGEES